MDWRTTLRDNIGDKDDAAVTDPSSDASLVSASKGVLTRLATIVASLAGTIPVIYNVTMTSADTEYSQALPANCKKFSMSVVNGNGLANYRVAFVTDKVATPTAPYIKSADGLEYGEDNINFASGTLYFAHSVGSKVMQIIAWS